MNFFTPPGGEAGTLKTLGPIAHGPAVSREKFAARLRRGLLARLRSWWQSRWRGWGSRPTRQLRLRETLALGERRFLLVVEFASQKFLIGSSGSAMTLLAELAPQPPAREEAEGEVSGICLARGKDATE